MNTYSLLPTQVVQAQLDAYNAKDVEGLLQIYAPDAEQYVLHGELLARGSEELRNRLTSRFKEPGLQVSLLSRVAMGNFVVDHELVRRGGSPTVELLCVYEVAGGRIKKASFAYGTASTTADG